MFVRNRNFEAQYDEAKLVGWTFRFIPILYVLNIIESLEARPPNGIYISRRQRFILNLDLNDYSYSDSVSDEINHYIKSATEFLRDVQKRIKSEVVNYYVRYHDQEYLVDCYQNALTNNSNPPSIFSKFECGWFVNFPYHILCFLDSSSKGRFPNLAEIFGKKITLCIRSADFSDHEIQQLFTLGAISKIIMMSDGGHASMIHYSSLFNRFHFLMDGLVWDSNNLKRPDFIEEEALRAKVVSTTKILINRIDRHRHDITIYFDYGYEPKHVDFHLNAIRQLCQKLINYLSLDEGNEHIKLINDINIFIDNFKSRVDFLNGIQAIEHDLYRYAYVISQNKYLYKIENGNTLFQETNIAGIYKELLAASATDKYIDYTQEEINGNGRTDIQIKCQKETIGIIEIKLLKKGDENRTEAIRKGLDQLYERYSQNHYRRIENNIILKLVLFCYDPNMRNLIDSIKNAIAEHEKRVKVKFTVFDSFKRNTIRIKLEESVHPLKTRVEHIDIAIVRLEDKYNKDRLAKKNYTVD